jgi:predicted kinase
MAGALTNAPAHLLAGLPGSGKCSYARGLEQWGIVRLCLDERVTARHGLLGTDYPASALFQLAAPVIAAVRLELVELIRRGRPVVLDHALDRRSEREDYKTLVTGNGGTWRLLYFKADRKTLLRRLAQRYAKGGVGDVTPEMLDWMAANWEPSLDEGEEILERA